MNNVLIVDDMELYRKLVREFLEVSGLPVNIFEASDGRYVERMVVQHDIDLLITDIVMEEREGLETISMVHKKFPHIKILAISGGGMADAKVYLSMARKLGAHRTLKKPFKKKEFLDAIQNDLLISK